ncbi:MAG TPA: pilus assembly protein TadG-related protein [Acidimicrobiales bacterium]|nr:pilus assembly protein TadG-related protein [Acidimicrobiales bacterium]
MTSIGRARKDDESGVVLIIFALAMVILLGMIAIALDGGYGFVQNRRAQNAADFAAFAAAQQLNSSAYCNGTTFPTTHQIAMVVQKLVDDNGSGVGTAWKAHFLNSAGKSIGTFTSNTGPGNPPPGACGVSVNATPQWTPFFAGIFGIHQLSGFASGSVGNVAKGPPIGILALNQVGPHEILGGGTGTFVVDGTIFVNSDVSLQPWTSSSANLQWDDAIDAKTSSNLYVYGPVDTVAGMYNGEPLWPLDHCFQAAGPQGGTSPGTLFATGDPTGPGATLPFVKLSCAESSGSVTFDYNSLSNTFQQITDPLGAPGAPAPPSVATTACPGMSPMTNPTTQVVGGVTQLLPGDYTYPVELTGSVNFQDCSGYATEGLDPGEGPYPGIYRFEQGLWINPGPGDTVTGSNVVLDTLAPYPVAGNVPGSTSGGTFTAAKNSDGTEVGGNGAPCLPSSTMTSKASGNGTPQSETSSSACGGTSPTTYGVTAYGDQCICVDSSMTGTGNNFSLIIGGAAGDTVNLTGPTTGPYAGVNSSPGIVLYQDPNTQANFGFNAEAGDSAAIDLTGVVYNASLTNYGNSSPADYWDGVGGGIPFYAGGTLQTGFGAGWSNGPAQSAGSVTLNGTAIVDDFNTDGNTNITILGQPYEVPGSGSLSFIG